jgi:hypothetical protein
MTYRRSAKEGWFVLVLGAVYMAFNIYAALPTTVSGFGGELIRIQQLSWTRVVALGIGVAFLAVGAVIIIRRARHAIVVDAEGITDTAVFADRVPWKAVQNVSLDGSRGAGYRLVLALTGPPGTAPMCVELQGLAQSASVVFQDAFDTWRAALRR